MTLERIDDLTLGKGISCTSSSFSSSMVVSTSFDILAMDIGRVKDSPSLLTSLTTFPVCSDSNAPGFRKEQKAYCLLFESVGIDGGIARIKQVPYKKLEQILEKKKW